MFKVEGIMSYALLPFESANVRKKKSDSVLLSWLWLLNKAWALMLSIPGPSASRACFIPAWNISTQRYQTRSIAFSIGLPFVELPELVFLSLPNISLPALSCTSFPLCWCPDIKPWGIALAFCLLPQLYFSFLERHWFQSLTAWEWISASVFRSCGIQITLTPFVPIAASIK